MFKDKEFDFVIAKHVLEHAVNIEKAISELQRVGKAGYIETPSEIKELLCNPRNYHNWIVMNKDNKLYIKRYENTLHKPFEWIYENNALFNRFLRRYRNLFYSRYWWEEKIDYELISDAKFILDYTDENNLRWLLKRSFKEKIIDIIVDIKKKFK